MQNNIKTSAMSSLAAITKYMFSRKKGFDVNMLCSFAKHSTVHDYQTPPPCSHESKKYCFRSFVLLIGSFFAALFFCFAFVKVLFLSHLFTKAVPLQSSNWKTSLESLPKERRSHYVSLKCSFLLSTLTLDSDMPTPGKTVPVLKVLHL